MFSSLIYFYLFFLYISFGTFFGQGIAPASQREVKQCNQNFGVRCITATHSLALSPWLLKAFKIPQWKVGGHIAAVLWDVAFRMFSIARSILAQFSSCFFSIHLGSVHVVHSYSSIDYQSIWLHTQGEDRSNTSSQWSPKRNCWSHNDAI